jgi:hypothetical protein
VEADVLLPFLAYGIGLADELFAKPSVTGMSSGPSIPPFLTGFCLSDLYAQRYHLKVKL